MSIFERLAKLLPHDKLLHFNVCAAVAFLVCVIAGTLTSPLIAAITALLVVVLIGGAKELADTRFDWSDMLSDFIGGVVGVIVYIVG